jgi:hypothetical protein
MYCTRQLVKAKRVYVQLGTCLGPQETGRSLNESKHTRTSHLTHLRKPPAL